MSHPPPHPDRSFFVTGGTLRADAPSYVERRADRELLEALVRGEYCYVLTARQMGKSSLMNRTAVRLRERGIQTVILDLTALGTNVTAEQWYEGLLGIVGLRLDLEDELEAFWHEHRSLGPLRRWMQALEEVVLPQSGVQAFRRSGVQEEPTVAPERLNTRTPERPSLVIFIDEIDTVRSLPFSTDEFFAAIRECYNRRTQDAAFQRLTFCLLGVATPSDLIRDTRTTPFNIGRRIELTDFTEAEAAPLAAGLSGVRAVRRSGVQAFRRSGYPSDPSDPSDPPDLTAPAPERLNARTPERLLQRILYWTGGHPYLTQRLCQAVAEEFRKQERGTRNEKAASAGPHPSSLIPYPSIVDRLCEALFLSRRARQQDDNLLLVRERLLRSEADAVSLLELYGRVRSGKRVRDEQEDPAVGVLLLSGIVRLVEGYLWVRNRIYYRVFDPEWVRGNMPDAEVRRQQAAFRRGLLRATSVSAVILAAMGSLALTAVNQAHRAENEKEAARRILYVAQMNLAQQALDAGNVGRTLKLLRAQVPRSGEADLRGFEWRYFWRCCQGHSRLILRGQADGIRSVAFSPDGKRVATGGFDRTVKLWNVGAALDPGREIATLQGLAGEVDGLTFSPDGRTLAAASGSQVSLWDVAGNRPPVHGKAAAVLRAPAGGFDAVAFSPNGRLLAGSGDGAWLWEAATRRLVRRLRTGDTDGA